MTHLNCDNAKIKAPLERLATLIRKEGGMLHDDLVINQCGPSISVSSTQDSSSDEALIRIPRHCLIPIEDFTISMHGENFTIAPTDRVKHPIQIEIAQLMFDIYNQLGKLKFHLESSPHFALKEEPALISALKALRPGRSKYFEMQEAGHSNKAIIESFLKTRTLGIQRTSQKPASRVLMPFIDYLNHHSGAKGFEFGDSDNGDEYVQVHNCQPVAGNTEVFVRYSRNLDLLDTYMGYGFHDTLSAYDFIRSSPLTLTDEKLGKLIIDSVMAPAFMGQLGPKNKDLRRWLPTLSKGASEKELDASYILIPCRHSKFVLRRSLALLWRSLNPGQQDLQDIVNWSEQYVLEENERRFLELVQLAEKPVSTNTSELALQAVRNIGASQLNKLNIYREMNAH